MDRITQETVTGLDMLDLKLLRELSANGKATNFALSDTVGRSASAIARRQRALEDEGVILSYQARLDLKRLGHGTTVHIKMTLVSQREEVLDAFETAIVNSPSVVRCDLMSGTDDYLVTILARSLDHFAQIHREELSRLPGVVRMESGFVLKEIVRSRLPPSLFAIVR